jgi:hypothetical protein
MRYIGNCSNKIDWNSVINTCRDIPGVRMTYDLNCFPDTDQFRELDKIWQGAGYKYGEPSIEWINYFPEQFGKEVVDSFAAIVNAKPWMVWISRINVGRMAPLHIDAHSKIDEVLLLGKPIRFTCFIEKRDDSLGHVSIVGDVAVSGANQGDIYEWPSYDAWHAGGNGGITDKFQFNFWGYR